MTYIMEAGMQKTARPIPLDIPLDPAVNDGKKFSANVQDEFPTLTDKNQIKQETFCKACFSLFPGQKAFVHPQCGTAPFY